MPIGFVLFLELIGTVAFSISGAVVGLQKKMDILGVVVLGLTTAIGGGIIRDLVLGIHPPMTFANPIYAIFAIITALIVFLPSVQRFVITENTIYTRFLLITDSLGLGIFTVVGIQTAHSHLPDPGIFILIFVGVITGVGGGLLRDVMAGNKPYIFFKHFYCCASILGAVACVFSWEFFGENTAMIIGTIVVVILRLLAAHYRWKLPKSLL